jgi:CRISPR-associated RAMP protein (TIGR02581 family)
LSLLHLGDQQLSLEGILVTRSPFRIGTAADIYITSKAQLQVIRMKVGNREEPYIPGSSLKGVFRSLCEKIVRSTNIKPYSCFPYEDTCGKKYKRELEESVEKNDSKLTQETIGKFCITCKMFGTLGFAGNVTFFDAYPRGRVSLAIREGVAVSRLYGSVAHGPFAIEYVSEGCKFSFAASLANLPGYCLGLLCTALSEVNCGRAFIGGMKSRGFGKCEVLLSRAESNDGIVEKSRSDDERDMQDFTRMFIEKHQKSWMTYVEAQK